MKYFTYWEGKEPTYIKMCYETMKRHIPDIIRLNENNANLYVDLPPEYYKIKSINHRVDYLKANLIYKYGGFWLDADTIVMKPIQDKLLDEHDYIGCPGFFGGRKGSETLKKWIDHMDIVIKTKSEFQWAELILPMVWENNKHKEIRNIELKYMCPFWGEKIRDIFFKDYGEYIDKSKDAIVVVLYNYVFPDWFKKMNRKEILEGNMVISELFRRSLSTQEVELPKFVQDINLSNVADKVNEIIKYLRYKNI